MTTFRPDTSFPYLKIAREHNVPYGDVIRLIERIDQDEKHYAKIGYHPWPAWVYAACRARDAECNRRLENK